MTLTSYNSQEWDTNVIEISVSAILCSQEREFSRIFNIGHWAFEYRMSNIEYPANFTFPLYTDPYIQDQFLNLNINCQHQSFQL